MAVKLNRSAFEHAKQVVGKGKVVVDEKTHGASTSDPLKKKTSLSEPTASASMGSGIWESTTKNPKIPRNITNFLMEISRRCTAVRCFPQRAATGQYKHFDIERAAAHLHGMIEELGQRVA